MAEAVKSGFEEAGGSVTIFQFVAQHLHPDTDQLVQPTEFPRLCLKRSSIKCMPPPNPTIPSSLPIRCLNLMHSSLEFRRGTATCPLSGRFVGFLLVAFQSSYSTFLRLDFLGLYRCPLGLRRSRREICFCLRFYSWPRWRTGSYHYEHVVHIHSPRIDFCSPWIFSLFPTDFQPG